jgi:protein gp37
MNKTQIEWVKNPDGTQGCTWNPITGCLNCENGLCRGGGFPCYAYKLAHGRVKPIYLKNPYLAGDISTDIEAAAREPFHPRLWFNRLHIPKSKTPRGIFPCDMSDLFGLGIPEEWTRAVLDEIQRHPDDRFYLLTKQSQNLAKFSPFPKNCWVGVTVTGDSMMQAAYEALDCIIAKVKYISVEPYLSELSGANIKLIAGAQYYKWLDWLIIGACTGTKADMEALVSRNPALMLMPWGKRWTAQPRIEWVREIIEAADAAGIPVFLKENLKPLIQEAGFRISDRAATEWVQCKYPILLQEMPTN